MGKSRALIISLAGGALLVAGMAVVGYVLFTLYERSRSGSDAGWFNFDTPTEVIAGATDSTPAAPAGSPAISHAASSLYPGDQINPMYWSDPLWAGASPFGLPGLPDGFVPLSPSDMALAPVVTGAAMRIKIEAIGLDSTVQTLGIVNLRDQREYETPKNTVGFIPDTALPGESARGWYFGHLESFALGEGNVFQRLPEVAGLIRHDPVDIIVSTSEVEYLYRVTGTRQVHQSNLVLDKGSNSSITLVTCWPPRVYDQRILVLAELIAIRRQA